MIKNVTLQNFKCFEEETFDFSSLNILTGLNGMGKSTLFQALLLLRQNYEIAIEAGKMERISLNGDLVKIGHPKDLLYQYFQSSLISIEIASEKEKVRWQWNGKSKDNDLFLNDHLPLKKTVSLDQKIFQSSLFSKSFHYLNAERLGPRAFYNTSNYDIAYKNQLGTCGEFTAHYFSEYEKKSIPIPLLKHPLEKGETLYEQVNAWMGELRKGTRLRANSDQNMGVVRLAYQFMDGELGNEFRPTNVGFGFSCFFPLLVALLSSPAHSLLLLENPEAHLHPQGQAKMGKLLALAAASGIQLMVETHSDHILNGIRVAVKEGIIPPNQANILFFTGEVIENKFQHYILNPRIDQNGRLDDCPDGFFDEFEKQLTSLL